MAHLSAQQVPGLCVCVFVCVCMRVTQRWERADLDYLGFLCSFFFLMGHTCGTRMFLGQGLNQSCSCQPTPQL